MIGCKNSSSGDQNVAFDVKTAFLHSSFKFDKWKQIHELSEPRRFFIGGNGFIRQMRIVTTGPYAIQLLRTSVRHFSDEIPIKKTNLWSIWSTLTRSGARLHQYHLSVCIYVNMCYVGRLYKHLFGTSTALSIQTEAASDKFRKCPTNHEHDRALTDRLPRKNIQHIIGGRVVSCQGVMPTALEMTERRQQNCSLTTALPTYSIRNP